MQDCSQTGAAIGTFVCLTLAVTPTHTWLDRYSNRDEANCWQGTSAPPGVTACVACPVAFLYSAGWAPAFPDGELGSNGPVGKLTLQNPAASLRSV